MFGILLTGFRSIAESSGNVIMTHDFSYETNLTDSTLRIQSQAVSTSSKLSQSTLLKKVPMKFFEILSKYLLLTPDQLKVLESQNERQIIFGAAGTGKTLILQAKCLELLRNGQKVVVYTTENYAPYYEKIFESNDFTIDMFKVCSNWKDGFITYIIKPVLKRLRSNTDSIDIIAKIYDYAEKQKNYYTLGLVNPEFGPLFKLENCFIDDFSDEYSAYTISLLFGLVAMALASQHSHKKNIMDGIGLS